MDLRRELKRLKWTFENEIRPALRRHEHYVGPGEARRIKARRARKREVRLRAREGRVRGL